MTASTETVTVNRILALARQLSPVNHCWLVDLLSRTSDVPLPERATLDEAIAFYLLDACSLGRAAELAGVTRWDIQDRLKEWRIPISVPGDQSAQEMDDLSEGREDHWHGGSGKTAVLGLLARHTSDKASRVQATVLPHVNRENLHGDIHQYVEPGTILYTNI